MAQAAGVDPYRAGTLRLALSETLAATVLPGFIEAFSAKHPEANVEMSVNSTAGQRAQLLDRAVDLAFLMGPVSEFRVANLPLIDLPMTWIISANHPLASVQKLSAEDLVNTPIMSYATDSRPFAELSDALKRIGIHKPKLFSSNALGASLSITQAGLAIATMPQVFAKPHLEAGDLVEVKAPISLNPLRFTASFRIETGNDLAAAAAELSVEAAKKWIATQSEKPIE
nr:substrate-binding domain-containing protein [Shimia abyssi]